MVPFSILVDVFVRHLLSGNLRDQRKGFKNRDRITAPASKIINFTNPRRLDKLVHELPDIVRMDVVAHLFTFIAKNFVGTAFQVAFDEITQKAM